jgi:hypothetical protein
VDVNFPYYYSKEYYTHMFHQVVKPYIAAFFGISLARIFAVDAIPNEDDSRKVRVLIRFLPDRQTELDILQQRGRAMSASRTPGEAEDADLPDENDVLPDDEDEEGDDQEDPLDIEDSIRYEDELRVQFPSPNDWQFNYDRAYAKLVRERRVRSFVPSP